MQHYHMLSCEGQSRGKPVACAYPPSWNALILMLFGGFMSLEIHELDALLPGPIAA